MRNVRPTRPSPAMVVALVALFVAMGGTGYAAIKLPKNSVGSKQIKRNAVTGAKVKNGSLSTSDFSSSARAGLRGPAGANGSQGIQGPQGLQGPPGPGVARRIFFATDDTGVTGQEILSLNGLVLRASCSPTALTVSAGSTVDNALVHSAVQSFSSQYSAPETVGGGSGGTIQDNTGGDEYREVDDLDSHDTSAVIDSTPAGDGGASQQGTLTYARPDGQTVTVTWASERNEFGEPDKACFFAGTALAPQ